MDSMYSFLAVLFVLAALVGTLTALRKRGLAVWGLPGATPKARRIEILERVAMGPQHALHVIRIAGRCVLVATSPSGCQLLDVPDLSSRGEEGGR
jgi:hypothetical protein